MRYRLIMNPTSCAGRGRQRWTVWERGLRSAGVAFECVETLDRAHAIRAAREAVAEGLAVVAVGGDGTINAVLDGALQSGAPGPCLGILYAGTSPDFCRFHGIPVRPEEALRRLVGGGRRRVDAARVEYAAADGNAQVAHFGCSCNLGMGAAIARRANRWRPCVGDVPGTAAAAVWALCGCPRLDLRVSIDGQPLDLPGTNNLSIAKNPYLASGLRLALDVRPDDGRLGVAAVQGRGRLGLLRLLRRFYDGTAATQGGLVIRYGRLVEVRSAAPCEVEFDGDPRGFAPVRIELLPRAIELLA